MQVKRYLAAWLCCSTTTFTVRAQDSLAFRQQLTTSTSPLSHSVDYNLHFNDAGNYPSFLQTGKSNAAHLPFESIDRSKDLLSFPDGSNSDPHQDNPGFSTPAIAIPAIGISYGVVALHHSSLRKLNLSTRNEIEEDHPYFITHVDNYLQWSPAAAMIGLNIAGVHGEHPFGDELCVYGVSTLIMAGTVFSVKHITHEERPDHSDFNSFPSGHTATAFAAAEWLRTEYWQRSPWIGIAGYTAATTTGILRLYNNKHWVSDVVAGAAIGFLSTRIAYAVNPWIEQHILHYKRQKMNFNH